MIIQRIKFVIRVSGLSAHTLQEKLNRYFGEEVNLFANLNKGKVRHTSKTGSDDKERNFKTMA